MSKKKTTEPATDTPTSTMLGGAVESPAEAPAAAAAGVTADQVTMLAASLLTSQRYAPAVKDEKEQDRVVGIAVSIAKKINAAVSR